MLYYLLVLVLCSYYMDDTYSKGDFIRWVIGNHAYESDGETLYGISPIYNHGIVMEVSDVDPACIIVHSRDAEWAPRLVILNGAIDEIEVLSSVETDNG